MLHGMIHEHTLNAAIVPVHCKVLHLFAVSRPLAIVLGWSHAAFHWSSPAPHHIHEHRDLMQVMVGWIHGAPVPILTAARDISLSIVEPVVAAVTGPGGNGLVVRHTMLEGGIIATKGSPRIIPVFFD